MKIYGGRDYYDCGLAFGSDPSIVLVRSKVDNVTSDVFIPGKYLKANSVSTYSLDNAAVVFCDKIYRGASIFGEWFWSADKFRKRIEKEKFLTVEAVVPWDQKKTNGDGFEAYFQVEDSPEFIREYMIENRIAILAETPSPYSHFSYKKKELSINPSDLKLMGFAKAVDPYIAFQELSMWIGGVLGGSSPKIETITDDLVLIENHGFDKKFSFRGPRIK